MEALLYCGCGLDVHKEVAAHNTGTGSVCGWMLLAK